MMEFDDVSVDDRVAVSVGVFCLFFLFSHPTCQVLWTETQQSFEGSVERVHNDNTFDVAYIAPIDGKIVKEFHVPRDRIQLLAKEEGYFTADANIHDQGSLALVSLFYRHFSCI